VLTAGTGAVAVMEANAREFADAFAVGTRIASAFAVDRVFTKREEK
jgi:hypothetical protein